VETLCVFLGHDHHVTALSLPKQVGTQSTCRALDCEAENLFWDEQELKYIEYGWGHTHPSYDVFFSSVDVHNQREHQSSLPEYFGFVDSALEDQCVPLQLTPQGMQCASQCTATGFHKGHRNETEVQLAAHVKVVGPEDNPFPDRPLMVFDFRSGNKVSRMIAPYQQTPAATAAEEKEEKEENPLDSKDTQSSKADSGGDADGKEAYENNSTSTTPIAHRLRSSSLASLQPQFGTPTRTRSLPVLPQAKEKKSADEADKSWSN
jgi:hypothetical protein